jgi:hypothetical protein
MFGAVPFEVLIGAGTILDLDSFENVAGDAQNRVSKQRMDILRACGPGQHDHCRTGVTMT